MRKVLPVAMMFILLSCYKKDVDPNTLNKTDKVFLNQVFVANKAEIEAGQMALRKSSHPLVQQFAISAIDHYSWSQADMNEVLQTIGYALTDTAMVHAQSMATLNSLEGFSFDTAYINSRVKSHEALVRQYQQELNEGNHTYVRYYFLNRNLDQVRKNFYKADSISRVL